MHQLVTHSARARNGSPCRSLDTRFKSRCRLAPAKLCCGVATGFVFGCCRASGRNEQSMKSLEGGNLSYARSWRPQGIRRQRNGLTATSSLRLHWPEHLMEAGELILYVLSVCALATLLQHPASPLPHMRSRGTWLFLAPETHHRHRVVLRMTAVRKCRPSTTEAGNA